MAEIKVFLSSTAQDLSRARDLAYQAIEGLDGYHCVRMEDFGARTERPDTICRQLLESCGLFVGVVGHVYGSLTDNGASSFTEMEYDVAREKNLPQVMFLAAENFPVPANLIEEDAFRVKQSAFRRRVMRDLQVATFDHVAELPVKILQGIRNWENTPSDRAPVPYRQIRGANILVVADQEPLQQMLRQALTEAGQHYLPAPSEVKALERLTSPDEPVDLILIDRDHRDLVGTDLVRAIRDKWMIPVLMISAQRDLDARLSGLDAGVDDYVTKPVSMGELVARVQSLLHGRGYSYGSDRERALAP